MSRTVARASLILLLAIWAGVIVGVSFVATPAKFLAPSLPIAVALDVGRHTFRILAWVELGIAAVISLLCWRAQANSLLVSGVAALWVIVLVERFWLVPLLDYRVSLYLSGVPPSPSHRHSLFIALEGLKVLVCVFCAARGLGDLVKSLTRNESLYLHQEPVVCIFSVHRDTLIRAHGGLFHFSLSANLALG